MILMILDMKDLLFDFGVALRKGVPPWISKVSDSSM
jgi:hypothetical protein